VVQQVRTTFLSRQSSWKIVADKQGSYGVASRELMPAANHDTGRYADNRAELSHQPTRARGRRRDSSACPSRRSTAGRSSTPASSRTRCAS
jgi:transposase-like protein